MKSKISFVVTTLLLPLTAQAKNPPPTPPSPRPLPPIACEWTELDTIAKNEIKNMISTATKLNPNSAVGFTTMGVELNSEVDPTTGFAKGVSYPFAVVNAAGQPIGGGLATVDGSCKVAGGTLDLSSGPLPVESL